MLVLEAVPDTVRVIDREPLFIAAFGGCDVSPRHAAIERAPHVVEESLEQAEIEKGSDVIRIQDRVAAKDIVLEHAGKRPGRAAIAGVTPARLAKVGSDAVKLPPTDRHLVTIGRIDRDRRLIRGVARDVMASRIDIHLETGEGVELRDHAR